MSLEAAKCPNCGAAIQVPNERESANCMYCGSVLQVKDAIEKLKIELSGQVTVSGIASVANDIERGNQCMLANDFQKAYNFYSNAIDKQADNYDAWYGCLKSITRNFASVDFSGVSSNGVMSLPSIALNCKKYAPAQLITLTINQLKILRDLIAQKIESDAMQKQKNSRLIRNIFGTFFAVCTIFGIMMFTATEGNPQFIVAVIFYIIISILCFKPSQKKFEDPTMMNCLNEIDNVIK